MFKKFVLIGFPVAASFLLVACPSKPPCDEKISADDRQTYQNNVLSNPLVERISFELHLLHVFAGDCNMAGKVTVVLDYAFPPSYSRYNLTYSDALHISYSVQAGSIEMAEGNIPGSLLDRDAILNTIRDKIKAVESNPRVIEFLSKTIVDTTTSPIRLDGVQIQAADGRSSIMYRPDSDIVGGYTLPNNIEWKEFPEIEQAHKIIQSKLLIGGLSNCIIDRSDSHGVAMVQFHDRPTAPWYIYVSVRCDDVPKSAWLQLNVDGSYERLELKEP